MLEVLCLSPAGSYAYKHKRPMVSTGTEQEEKRRLPVVEPTVRQ